MENKIDVVLCKVAEPPVAITIDNTLEAMQHLVGGFVECVNIADGVDLWCNENGKLDRLPPNRFLTDDNGTPFDVICGDFFISGVDEEEGECASLTQEQIEFYINEYDYHVV